MKKVLTMLIVASLAFVSCHKSDTISSLDGQKGKKDKTQQLTVNVATSVPLDWTPDTSLKILSATWVGNGNNIVYSLTADPSDLPQILLTVEVYVPATDSTKAIWKSVGSPKQIIYYADPFVSQVFDGYPGQADKRVYRVVFQGQIEGLTDSFKISEPYQIN